MLSWGRQQGSSQVGFRGCNPPTGSRASGSRSSQGDKAMDDKMGQRTPHRLPSRARAGGLVGLMGVGRLSPRRLRADVCLSIDEAA